MSYARDQRKAQVKQDQQLMQRQAMEGLKRSEVYKCICGSSVFVETFSMRRISPLYTPDKQPRFIPIETYRCMSCGKVPGDYEHEQKDVQKNKTDVQGGSISGNDDNVVHTDGKKS